MISGEDGNLLAEFWQKFFAWLLCCLEWEMATHLSILAWKILWTEEPDGLQSMGSQRVGHDWVTLAQSCDWAIDAHLPSGSVNVWSVLVCSGCHGRISRTSQTGSLPNSNVFSHSSGGWKFEIKVLAALASGEVSLAGRWAPPWCVLMWPFLCVIASLVSSSSFRDSSAIGLGFHPSDFF